MAKEIRAALKEIENKNRNYSLTPLQLVCEARELSLLYPIEAGNLHNHQD